MIMVEVDVVYSDHVAVCVSIEWKVKKKIQQKKRKYVNNNKNLDSSLYNEFGNLMCDSAYRLREYECIKDGSR